MLKRVTMIRRTKIVTEVVEGYKVKSTLFVDGKKMEMVSANTWVREEGAERMALEWVSLIR